jgi:hypothetical protein
MVACGIWRAQRRLVAVVVDDDGRASPALTAAMDDDERWGLLETLDAEHGLDYSLVLSASLVRNDTIGDLALTRGLQLWSAPQLLVTAIRNVIGPTSDARLAAMLGRLVLVQGFREHLQLFQRDAQDRRQLRLL